MIPQYPCLRLKYKEMEDKCLETCGPCRAMASLGPVSRGANPPHPHPKFPSEPPETSQSSLHWGTAEGDIQGSTNKPVVPRGAQKWNICSRRALQHHTGRAGDVAGLEHQKKNHLRNSKLEPSCFQLTLAWHNEWQKADWAGCGISHFNNWNVRYLYPPELLNVSYWQQLRVPAFLHSAHILEKYSC